MDDIAIHIKRPIYDQKQFDKEFLKEASLPQPLLQRLVQNSRAKFKCSGICLLETILLFFPFITVLKTYKWKENILGDIIAGMCVGVVHIPQSMGFAVITSLPPVYGLYSTLFPVVIYFIFGTSRHISVGTMAIISIMIGAIVARESAAFQPTLSDNATQIELQEKIVDFKVDIATSVTLLVGFIQFGMGLLRLGLVATFMSMSFIGGFMTGAAFHIATSQVPFMLGIQIPRQVGVFRLAKNWYWICRHLPQTNLADLLISMICVAILVIMKDVINDKFKHKLKIPLPAELIVVVLGTMISYFANMNERYSIKIVEDIPLGLPVPRVPSLHHASTYIVDAIAIAVVSYAISMSLAKSMSHKHRYPIDQKQELLAHGMMHTIGACLSSFGGAAAPPRTLVHESSGGKSLIASLVSAALVLLVCLAIGPLFEALPFSVLGSICTIAIEPLFRQFQDLPRFWKLNRYDFYVWIVTFFSVVILDVDYGLYVGMGISLLTIVVQTHRGKGKVLVQTGNTELYMPTKLYKHKAQQSKVKIFKFESPLYFANVDSFKQQLYEQTFNPTIQNHSDKALSTNTSNGVVVSNASNLTIMPSVAQCPTLNEEALCDRANSDAKSPIRPTLFNAECDVAVKDTTKYASYIIIDCSAISYVDTMGLNTLKQVSTDYSSCGVYFAFANCSQCLLHKMLINDTDVANRVFPSNHDAVTCICDKQTEPDMCIRF